MQTYLRRSPQLTYLVALSLLSVNNRPATAWTASSTSFDLARRTLPFSLAISSLSRTACASSLSSRSNLASFTSSAADSSCSAMSSTLTVTQVPCLSDNYGYIIHDEATGATAVVDTPEAKPYQDELAKRGWTLTHILNTHQ